MELDFHCGSESYICLDLHTFLGGSTDADNATCSLLDQHLAGEMSYPHDESIAE